MRQVLHALCACRPTLRHSAWPYHIERASRCSRTHWLSINVHLQERRTMTFSTIPDTSFVNNMDLHQAPSHDGDIPPQGTHAPRPASGEKAKARAILAAIRTLHAVEQAQRPATPEERTVLARFPGFGPVALGIFPDPVTGRYKDAGWQQLGDQLQALLTPEDYASARRTTFTAFYTAPVVIRAMHDAL